MSLVGMKAPEFSLINEQGNLVTLEQYKGKYVVLYFYPKDMTQVARQKRVILEMLMRSFRI